MMIVLGLILFFTDRKIVNSESWNNFLAICPLTSIFLPQKCLRRTAILLQILASEMLLLTIIGGLMYYFDSPEDKTSYTFDKYYGFQLSRGAIAWTLCQVYTLPIFILNSLAFRYKNLKFPYIVTIITSIVIAFGCLAGIIVMTLKYCGGWTEFWIVNFLIFTLFDWATLEMIYSIIIWLLLGSKNTGEPSSRQDIKRLAASNVVTENDTERNRRAGSDEENDSAVYGPIIINN